MKASDYVALKVDRFRKGYVFTYRNFISEDNRQQAVIKALNRMVQSGKIARLSKGKYYKPKSTIFGNLRPNQAEMLKDLLEDDGRITGYLTGYSIYNQLGLTTQISAVIQIGKQDIRPAFTREFYRISFIRQKNTITKETIPLLQILDAIRAIKKIPDTGLKSIIKRLLALLKNLPDKDKSRIVRLALNYPPATRALLGALLDELQIHSLTPSLYETLNPVTRYKLSGLRRILSAAGKWNIV